MNTNNNKEFDFISVGIMVPQNPYWFVSSLGAMFAGGLRLEPSLL